MLFWISLFIPLVGTVFGAAAVFLIKRKGGGVLMASLDGLAAGVMTASAIFSLLFPAFDGSRAATLPLSGLLFGFLFFLAAECLALHFSRKELPTFAVFAITLHNLPEGMAVGIALAGVLMEEAGMTAGAALMLAVGIAIQNIPEGAIVSLPTYADGKGKGRAFFIGALSGVIEPIGAVAALLLFQIARSLLPFFLAFAASAMLSVVVGELSASFQGKKGAIGRLFFALGFVFMTALDVLLS